MLASANSANSGRDKAKPNVRRLLELEQQKNRATKRKQPRVVQHYQQEMLTSAYCTSQGLN